MMKWEEIEEKGYQKLLNDYPKAIKYGKNNSVYSDVYLPELNSFVEIKDLSSGSRCGQFTANTAEGDYCNKIMSGKYTDKDIKDFIYNHYKKKNVSKFLIYFNEKFELLTFEEFLDKMNFSVQVYNKRSGTRKVPKKDLEEIIKYNSSFIKRQDEIICLNPSLFNTYFKIKEDTFYINKKGQVRKRSETNNRTWLIEVHYR